METIAWRYHPEFRVQVLIDDQPVSSGIRLIPDLSTPAFRNYGLLTRFDESGIICFQRQRRTGGTFVPAVDLVSPERFRFLLEIQLEMLSAPLDFFSASSVRFGRTVLYTNNLDAAGGVDTTLAGNVVSLTNALAAGDSERASVSLPILSTEVNAAEFTQIAAGLIEPGNAVVLDQVNTLSTTDTTAKLDLLDAPAGAYRVELDGPAPHEETVFVQDRAGATVQGFIDIYRDSWLSPTEPREYRLNFASA